MAINDLHHPVQNTAFYLPNFWDLISYLNLPGIQVTDAMVARDGDMLDDVLVHGMDQQEHENQLRNTLNPYSWDHI